MRRDWDVDGKERYRIVSSLGSIVRPVMPGKPLVRRLISGLTLVGLFGAPSPSQEQPKEPQTFLSKHLGFSHDQILQVEHGAVVAKVLKPDKHDVGAVAVVRVNAPQEFFVARFRDIERHKRGEAVLQVRKFSEPPQPDDLKDLTLSPQEVRDLKGCRPGSCKFKLSAQMISQLHQQVDFSAPDSAEQANRAMRNLLGNFVLDYVAQGNSAMMDYADKEPAVSSAAQFAELLERLPSLMEYAPEFREYLANFPGAGLPGAENFQYWSRENYGHDLRPVLAITHVTIYVRSGGKNPPVLIASKQIYASHYFEASLGLTMLFERAEGDPAPSFYLVYVNRSRIDLLRKWYSGLARGNLSESVRSSMRKNLFDLKSKVEAEYEASQAVNPLPAPRNLKQRRQGTH